MLDLAVEIIIGDQGGGVECDAAFAAARDYP